MFLYLLISLISGLTTLFFLALLLLWLDIFWAIGAAIACVPWAGFMFVQGYFLDKGMKQKWNVVLDQKKVETSVLFLTLSIVEAVLGFILVGSAFASGNGRLLWGVVISFAVYFVLAYLALNGHYKKFNDYDNTPQTDKHNRLSGRHY